MSSTYKALLIDDSKPVNFFNKVVLQRSQFFSDIQISENGQAAMHVLANGFDPDIIFLDINMPVMNGWEFLKNYTSTTKEPCPIVLLLGAQLSKNDKARVAEYLQIKDVKGKMLSFEIVMEIKNSILDC